MMKKVIAAIAALMLVSPAVYSQNATKKLNIGWTLPTVAMDGTALTGTQALTKVQVFISGSTIPSNTTMAPAVELGPTLTSTQRDVTLPIGGTAFVRLKACNSTGCSDFSAEASYTFPTSAPGVPTNVTITVTLQ